MNATADSILDLTLHFTLDSTLGSNLDSILHLALDSTLDHIVFALGFGIVGSHTAVQRLPCFWG